MTLLGFGDCDCERAGAGTSAGEILACGAVIHNLPPPCCAEPLRSVMNNCDTDISGDCPPKHLVRSNLKLERSDSFTLAPKRSRLGVVRECRDASGSRNTQRQTQRRDGDCGLGRYHA